MNSSSISDYAKYKYLRGILLEDQQDTPTLKEAVEAHGSIAELHRGFAQYGESDSASYRNGFPKITP